MLDRRLNRHFDSSRRRRSPRPSSPDSHCSLATPRRIESFSGRSRNTARNQEGQAVDAKTSADHHRRTPSTASPDFPSSQRQKTNAPTPFEHTPLRVLLQAVQPGFQPARRAQRRTRAPTPRLYTCRSRCADNFSRLLPPLNSVPDVPFRVDSDLFPRVQAIFGTLGRDQLAHQLLHPDPRQPGSGPEYQGDANATFSRNKALQPAFCLPEISCHRFGMLTTYLPRRDDQSTIFACPLHPSHPLFRRLPILHSRAQIHYCNGDSPIITNHP